MKKTLWIGVLCAISLVSACALAACRHEHTYETKWSQSATEHWHTATCEHTDQEKDRAAHDFGEDGKCIVCDYEKHEHSYDTELTAIDDTYHWYAPTCNDTTEGKDKAKHDFGEDGKCTGCGYQKPVPPHDKHTYDTKRTPVLGEEAEYHWFAPTCDDTTEGLHKEMHVFENNNKCFLCEYEFVTENPEIEGRYYFYDFEIDTPWDELLFLDLKPEGVARLYLVDGSETTDLMGTYTLDGTSITIEFSDYSFTGTIGDDVKMSKGAMLLDWGDEEPYYFCKYYSTPELVMGYWVVEYVEAADGYSILGVTSDFPEGETEITIPEELNNKPVVAISDYAFQGSPLTKVVIGNNVKTIGIAAFANCSSLSEIVFGKSVDLGLNDDAVFDMCGALSKIMVSKENAKYFDQGNCLIERGENGKNILVLGGNLSEIPSDGSIVTIWHNAFKDRTGIQTLVIPEGVTYIGVQAFDGCRNMRTITLPATLQQIDTFAFSNCVYLNKIVFNGTSEQWAAIVAKGDSYGFGWDKIDKWLTDTTVECLGNDAEPVTYTVTVKQPEGGVLMITKGQKDTYSIGDELTFMISANDGYTFTSLLVNDKDVTKDVWQQKYTLTVTEDMTVEAVFTKTGGGSEGTYTAELGEYDDEVIEAEIVGYDGDEVTIGLWFNDYSFDIDSIKIMIDGEEVEFGYEDCWDDDWDYYITITLTEDCTITIVCER